MDHAEWNSFVDPPFTSNPDEVKAFLIRMRALEVQDAAVLYAISEAERLLAELEAEQAELEREEHQNAA